MWPHKLITKPSLLVLAWYATLSVPPLTTRVDANRILCKCTVKIIPLTFASIGWAALANQVSGASLHTHRETFVSRDSILHNFSPHTACRDKCPALTKQGQGHRRGRLSGWPPATTRAEMCRLTADRQLLHTLESLLSLLGAAAQAKMKWVGTGWLMAALPISNKFLQAIELVPAPIIRLFCSAAKVAKGGDG